VIEELLMKLTSSSDVSLEVYLIGKGFSRFADSLAELDLSVLQKILSHPNFRPGNPELLGSFVISKVPLLEVVDIASLSPETVADFFGMIDVELTNVSVQRRLASRLRGESLRSLTRLLSVRRGKEFPPSEELLKWDNRNTN
jgi:hypothetical protein